MLSANGCRECSKSHIRDQKTCLRGGLQLFWRNPKDLSSYQDHYLNRIPFNSAVVILKVAKKMHFGFRFVKQSPPLSRLEFRGILPVSKHGNMSLEISYDNLILELFPSATNAQIMQG